MNYNMNNINYNILQNINYNYKEGEEINFGGIDEDLCKITYGNNY